MLNFVLRVMDRHIAGLRHLVGTEPHWILPLMPGRQSLGWDTFASATTVRRHVRYITANVCMLVVPEPEVWPRVYEASVWELRKQQPAMRDRHRDKKCGRNAGVAVS